jgi:hypothetical protein
MKEEEEEQKEDLHTHTHSLRNANRSISRGLSPISLSPSVAPIKPNNTKTPIHFNCDQKPFQRETHTIENDQIKIK